MTDAIAILGGAGAEGGGLALRWARAGRRVIIGSRSAARAEAAAADMTALLGGASITGAENAAAANAGNIVVLTVPYAAQEETALRVAPALKGKMLIDVTAPLRPPKVALVQLPPEGACAVALQAKLGPEVRVVSAFQNISAVHLRDVDHAIDCDVLVSADAKEDADTVIALAAEAGMRAFHAGPLANAAAAEALTSVLIALNRRYKVPGTGVRITGL